jgi:2',3'-cyclic-nucleotide 2'-phosphodiesterase (5'-nucleotidase family)
MGLEYDIKLAESSHLIDVIVGGHSHHVLDEPQMVQGVIITQAGSYGSFLGKLDLWVDTDSDTVVNYDGELFSLNSRNFLPNPAVQAVVDSLEKSIQLNLEDLGEVIAELKTDWIRSGGESNIGNWISDTFRDFTGSDIAFVNSGGIRKDLSKGPITKRDLWEIAPFGNYVVMFRAFGKEIYDILEQSLFGPLGSYQVSGLKIRYNTSSQDREKIVEILIQGHPIDMNKRYTVTTIDYVYNNLVEVNHIISGDRKINQFDLDRDILIRKAIDQKEIYSRIEGRILKVQ